MSINFAVLILMIVSMWRIYTKAGEAGWKSLIPFYSTYVMLKFTGRPTRWMWYIFLPAIIYVPACSCLSLNIHGVIGLAPWMVLTLAIVIFSSFVVMLVFGIRIHLSLCDRFGVSRWFTLGIYLLPIIFLPVLAFGDYVYTAPENESESPFGRKPLAVEEKEDDKEENSFWNE